MACVAAGFLREDLRAGGVRAGERRAGGEKGEVRKTAVGELRILLIEYQDFT